MQKKIVAMAATMLCATAIPAMAQTTNTSKVELWGIADAAIRHTTNEGANKSGLTKLIGGGMSQSRWGINVEEDLGGGSKALVHLEHRFNLDSGEKDATAPFFQLAYVGLQGPYGRLTMGRQWNVLFDVVSSTYASFPYSPYMDAYKPELGMAAGARSSNALKYTLATPDRSWVGTLQYAFAEGNDTKAVKDAAVTYAKTTSINAALPLGYQTSLGPLLGTGQQVIDGMVSGINPSAPAPGTENLVKTATGTATGALKNAGGFLRYSANGFAVGGGFLRTYLPGGTDLDAWTVGGSYRQDKLYLNLGYGLNKVKRPKFSGTSVQDYLEYKASMYVDQNVLNGFWQGQTNGGFQAGDADKRQMVKMGFGYQVTPQVNTGIHYYYAKQSGDPTGAYNGNAHFVVALANYAFSKRTDAYMAVDFTRVNGGEKMSVDPNGATKRQGFTVGLRHRF